MATPGKKRDVEQMETHSDDDSEYDDEDSSSGCEDEEDILTSGTVEVDFEAMPPSDNDFDGIRSLLYQLFLKANINLSQLTETIISQNYVGCVIKQCEVPEEDESDDDIEEDPVFGVMSVINIMEKKNLECVKEIKDLILTNCEKYAADKLPEFQQLLDCNSSKQIGLLIHERFINIPSTIAVPMYESLKKDLESDKAKNMKYTFDQYIFICKTCRPQPEEESKDSVIDIKDVVFLNAEEEFLMQFAKNHFTISVANQRDSIGDGEWEDELECLRTIIVIDGNKIDSAVAAMKAAIEKA